MGERTDTAAGAEGLWREFSASVAAGPFDSSIRETEVRRAPVVAPATWAERIAAEGVDAFDAILHRLLSVNPAIPLRAQRVVRATAARLGSDAIPSLRRQVARLIDQTQQRPERRAEIILVDEIRRKFEEAAERLLDRGELGLPPDAAAAGEGRTDLVLARELSPRQVVRIEEEAALSPSDWRVLDGHRNRVDVVDTPLLVLLRALAVAGPDGVALLVDLWRAPERVLGPSAAGAAGRAGALDPSVRRDIISALGEAVLAPSDDGRADAARDLLREVIGDAAIRREYPRIHREARRPLVMLALRHWHDRGRAEGRRFSRSIARLVDDQGRVRWDRVDRMIAGQLDELAAAVRLFLQQGRRFRARATASRTLLVEVGALVDSVHLLLLVSEAFLWRVHGCRRFAEALFGLNAAALFGIRERADSAVRRQMERSALRTLKRRRTMVEFVQSLSLVDPHTRERVLAMIDIGTGQFPTIKVKNAAMSLLAVPYQEKEADRRLLQDLQKRFRALVRVLHEDAVRARLNPDDLRELTPRLGDVRDLYELLVASRDYLVSMTTRYEDPTDDFIFADEEYKAGIETRLARLLTRPEHGFAPAPAPRPVD